MEGWDEFEGGLNKWAMGAMEEAFAKEVAKKARGLGLDTSTSIELDTSEVDSLGDEKVNPDRIHALADALLASGVDLDDDDEEEEEAH